jgi:hypothetical protein
MNDASLAAQAQGRTFRVPEGRYYVGDAGFGARKGLSIPFPLVRYHIEDWGNADVPPKDAKELYNLRHARIRVVVEQAFGRLKRRFKILRGCPPEYSVPDQIRFVYASTAIHNFLIQQRDVPELSELEKECMEAARQRADRVISSRRSEEVRQLAAYLMYKEYQVYKARWERRRRAVGL